eukprot:Gb_33235 [translate_table: standard]
MGATEAGRWLEDSLLYLCSKVESGLQLDPDVISGLVSYCELAPPEDAREYLNNIVGQESSQGIIDEYIQRRCSTRNPNNVDRVPKEDMQAYMKPPAEEFWSVGSRKVTKNSKERNQVIIEQEFKAPLEIAEAKDGAKVKANGTRRKKGSKVITLAEAAKGSIVFQRGIPCDCQARRHKLVSNCLSCGKIICEQEGEGPCSFCGALVLCEGSNYAGLDKTAFPLSEAEAVAEAFKNRLVDYDRNAAERTIVIDDQSDYYEIEGNTWISEEEKQLLRKKQEEIEEAECARRKKVIVTLDLVGRKVVMTEDEAAELETQSSILRPNPNFEERMCSRIKANPSIRENPVYIDTRAAMGANRSIPFKGKKPVGFQVGVCLAISGRVQHDDPLVEALSTSGFKSKETPLDSSWQQPKVQMESRKLEGQSNEC